MLLGGAALIVTNNPDICRPLQEVVEGAGCRAVVADDGPRALREIQRASPRVVLLDLDSPEALVEQVAVMLRSAYGSTIAVIVFSAGSDGRIRA
jgi:DNA-binding response OmpR family regulator